MGNGTSTNQYTGEAGNARGPFPIDFSAFNPDVGLPWIDAQLRWSGSPPCVYTDNDAYQVGARWWLDVNDKRKSRRGALCTYTMVGSRAADGGTDRVTGAPADYKMLTLEAYAPDQGVSCLEPTPGPVIKPWSPNGEWSCWPAGPKPPSDVPEIPVGG